MTERVGEDHSTSAAETITKPTTVAASAMTGLSSAEAARRLAEAGANDVAEEHERLIGRIARHFWAPVPWMLEAAIFR